ncbi:MAG: TIGR02757 family protein [Elusimicrobiota bacterium]|jgi:uncharacterized protein (TIGR02757 family)|nr:TIGR02757 family protein [Elusimicrobiota bacterium]
MITKEFLEDLYDRYNKAALIPPDPLQFVRDYAADEDREIAALIAACFAYGNVKQIIKNVGNILSAMGPSPRAFLLACDEESLNKTFAGFKYRFTAQQELVSFLLALAGILKEYGTLENLFFSIYDKDGDYLAAMRAFAARVRAGGAAATLMPDPEKTSALKRLNLFLRWAIRRDEVDPGFWRKIPAADLIVPLDVHMHRVGRMLGLTKRNQADMKTAVEISRSFAQFCPQDPVKYDFCLTRFGIRDDMSEEDILNALN